MTAPTSLPEHCSLINHAMRIHRERVGGSAELVSAEAIWHRGNGLDLELVIHLSDGHTFSVRAPYPEPAKILRELGEPLH